MPYTPTNWRTGDIVSSEKLNNIESGLANIGTAWFEVQRSSLQPYTLNKTAQEICDAVARGSRVRYRLDTGGGGDVSHYLMIVAPLSSTSGYAIEFQFGYFGSSTDIYKYRAATMDDYPVDDYNDAVIYDNEYYPIIEDTPTTVDT